MNSRNVVLGTLAVLLLGGCSTLYFNTMEKMGYPKRDIMVDRVEKARDSQEAAKEQFQSALESFSSVTGYAGGDLEKTYRELNDEYERCRARADAVSDRIAAVEDVAGALFAEWEAELDQYSSQQLKAASRRKLENTRRQYAGLLAAMRRAESRMKPVLGAFHDQVLFLKHNLNAQAVASLKTELHAIEGDVAVLIREMEKSIAEADSFIKNMEQ